MPNIAIILHGNLRTFFMPLREDRSTCVCDVFYENIIKPNNADIFISTDTSDFYYEGIQYFDETQKKYIKICNNSMFYKAIDFMEHNRAKKLLTDKLNSMFDIKCIDIKPYFDISSDSKFIALSNSKSYIPEKYANRNKGCIPERIVNQYLKINSAYDMLKTYESKNRVYDIVFRGRFDNLYERKKIDLSSFDYASYDIFTPGPGPENRIIYDWAAFGRRQYMGIPLSLYEKLGFTLNNRTYVCHRCGMSTSIDTDNCNCGNKNNYEDISLSSEYHLYRLFKDHNIRYTMGLNCLPYRYGV